MRPTVNNLGVIVGGKPVFTEVKEPQYRYSIERAISSLADNSVQIATLIRLQLDAMAGLRDEMRKLNENLAGLKFDQTGREQQFKETSIYPQAPITKPAGATDFLDDRKIEIAAMLLGDKNLKTVDNKKVIKQSLTK